MTFIPVIKRFKKIGLCCESSWNICSSFFYGLMRAFCTHHETRKNGKKINCFMTHNPLTLELPFYATNLINKFYSVRRDREKKKKQIIKSAKIVFKRWWSSGWLGDDQEEEELNSSTVRAYAARTFLFAFLRSFNALQIPNSFSSLVKRKFNIFCQFKHRRSASLLKKWFFFSPINATSGSQCLLYEREKSRLEYEMTSLWFGSDFQSNF